MFRDLLAPIAREFSGKRAWRDVSQLWQFRNTVTTPGLREACRYCVERFKENEVAARLDSYPADGRTRYGFSGPLPLEWEARSATLSIVKPKEEARRLTSYEEEALSLSCRSAATPKGGVEAQVVIVKDGTKPEHYQGMNVKGKIVMTDRQPSAVAAQAAKHGAIGIIADTYERPRMPGEGERVREPFDGPDAVQWSCLSGMGETKRLFGFILAPRMGLRLRKLIESSPKPVVVRAEVDARSYAGHSDVVNGVVKGTGEEELWVLAHISEPGAYDNASGCAASLEIGRTLEALYRKRILPRPKRSVRFLFSTEVSGFLPFLEEHKKQWPKVLAGLCVDSVGVDMGKIGGEFIIYRAPESSPSFMEHFLAEVAEAVHNMRFDHFGENNYALWPWRLAPYWGNDAFITDSYYDIPTPQLSCWPYRYYHTSMDLPEFISPDNLARTGVMCAAALHFLANAGPKDAAWISALTAAKARTRIADELNAEVLRQVKALKGKKTRKALEPAATKLAQCADYYAELEDEAIVQPLRFAPGNKAVSEFVSELAGEVMDGAEFEHGCARGLLSALVGADVPHAPEGEPSPFAQEAIELVPRRTAWRIPEQKRIPARPRKDLAALRKSPECKGINLDEVWPWANGKRSVFDIWLRLRYKREYPLQALVRYFRILARAGLVEMMKGSRF